MSVQVGGFSVNTLGEVETNTKALRGIIKPVLPYGSGSFCMAAKPVTLGNTLAYSAAPLWAFRWRSPATICSIKKVNVHAISGITAVAAQVFTFALTIMRDIDYMPAVDNVGGTSVGIPSKLYTGAPTLRDTQPKSALRDSGLFGTYESFPGTSVFLTNFDFISDATLVTGLSLSSGTITDANPVAAITTSLAAVATRFIQQPANLWDVGWGDHPIMLDENTGFLVKFTGTSPGSTTPQLSIQVQWEEVPLASI